MYTEKDYVCMCAQVWLIVELLKEAKISRIIIPKRNHLTVNTMKLGELYYFDASATALGNTVQK